MPLWRMQVTPQCMQERYAYAHFPRGKDGTRLFIRVHLRLSAHLVAENNIDTVPLRNSGKVLLLSIHVSPISTNKRKHAPVATTKIQHHNSTQGHFWDSVYVGISTISTVPDPSMSYRKKISAFALTSKEDWNILARLCVLARHGCFRRF